MLAPRSHPAISLHLMQGDFPRFNVKSTLVPCPDTGYVFLYGGFDENDNLDSNVYLYNMATRQWEVDSAHSGLYRDGHLALYLGDGNVFVFGGVPEDEVPRLDPRDDDAKLRKDLLMLMYSIYDRSWQSAPSLFLANAPSGRSRHACCLSGDRRTIYISGGLINSTPLADLYSYNLRSGTWLGPVEFIERFDHSISIHDGKLYSFGGLDGDMNHVSNKVSYMNLADRSMVDILTKDGPKKKPNTTFLLTDTELFGGMLLTQEYSMDQDKQTEDDSDILPATYEKFWLDSGNPVVKLEVSVPLCGRERSQRGISVTLTDLSSYSRTSLLTQRDIVRYANVSNDPISDLVANIPDYQWRHAFVVNNHLCLLGHFHSDTEQAHSTSNLLSTVLEVTLLSLGVDSQTLKDEISLISDLRTFFLNGQYTDFLILAFKDQQTKDQHANSEIDSSLLLDPGFVAENLLLVPVHKSILLARWPHFRRVINSGMSETRSGQLFVPEPYAPVHHLLYYLYTGTLGITGVIGSDVTAVEYSALLVLSNLYELQELRSMVLFVLFRKFTSDQFMLSEVTDPDLLEHAIDSILQVWQNAYVLNEDLFMGKVEDLIHSNWSLISRSRLFMGLSKVLIVKLCQDCFDRKNQVNTPKSKRDSFDSTTSSTMSPAIQYRNEHSNSPFTKSFDDELSSPREQLSHIRSMSSFPQLQSIPRLSDFL